MSKPMTFVRIDTKHRRERTRYEVHTPRGCIGEVFHREGGWYAEVNGQLVVRDTRGAAAAALSYLRDRPVVIRQDVIVVGERRDREKRADNPKGERAAAARKVLRDHALLLDSAGVTAKVASDGFVYLSPAALERLLALVDAA